MGDREARRGQSARHGDGPRTPNAPRPTAAPPHPPARAPAGRPIAATHTGSAPRSPARARPRSPARRSLRPAHTPCAALAGTAFHRQLQGKLGDVEYVTPDALPQHPAARVVGTLRRLWRAGGMGEIAADMGGRHRGGWLCRGGGWGSQLQLGWNMCQQLSRFASVHACARARVSARRHTRARTRAHARTHTHTHAHARGGTHARTHATKTHAKRARARRRLLFAGRHLGWPRRHAAAQGPAEALAVADPRARVVGL
jgi:hypothetical protein